MRTIRTTSSERHLVQNEAGLDVAALDLHFLDDGSVAGTLILLDDDFANSHPTEELLQQIDEVLLPMVSFDEKNLTFTVVAGKSIGSFVPDSQSNPM